MKRFISLTAIAMMLAVAAGVHAAPVTFQVNMSIQDSINQFDPASNQVVVRGAPINEWSGNANALTDPDHDGIWTGTWEIAAGHMEFKYVIPHSGPDDNWEDVDNRTYEVGTDPVTLPVVFFDNLTEVPQIDSSNVEILFRVDMRVQDLNGNFDPAIDWVVVRGGNDSLGSPGGWNGARRMEPEPTNPGVYSVRVLMPQLPEDTLEYKFVILHAGDVNDPNPRWEQLPSGGNRIVVHTGDEPDVFPPPSGNGYGDLNLPLAYFDDASFDDIISHDLTVIFQVEDTPLRGRMADSGFTRDVQTGDSIFTIERLDFVGAFGVGWQWGNLADANRVRDDGVAPDLTANDHVYTGQFVFPAGTARRLEYKYGANMLDAEAGFARNHVRILDDTNNEFRMDVDCWGSPDVLYDLWPCVISAVDETQSPNMPDAFTLEQNFPNPFNPTTAINFTVNHRENVKLVVFDVTGREVTTTNLGLLEPGQHSVGFDGSSFATGVYFYRLETPSFSQTRKMLLLK